LIAHVDVPPMEPGPSWGDKRHEMPIPAPMFVRLTLLCLFMGTHQRLFAAPPPLLAEAIQKWTAGEGDLAFTQHTRTFLSDGRVKDERIERYDPSLPDSRRWHLMSVGGLPATDLQRQEWETRKNSRPRTKVDESPGAFLDLENAVQIGETAEVSRFRIPVKPRAMHLVSLEEIDAVISVDKHTRSIASAGAALREPIRVLLGIGRITDLDVDVRINPGDAGSPAAVEDVEEGSTARVKISKLGRPVEYSWSDFKRVRPFSAP
jgi:hypothetical protein